MRRLYSFIFIRVWNQEPKNFLDEPYCGVLKSNGYFEDLPCRSYKAAAICELDNTRKKWSFLQFWLTYIPSEQLHINVDAIVRCV